MMEVSFLGGVYNLNFAVELMADVSKEEVDLRLGSHLA